ncbi:MAG: urea transporter, partial [Muribaculaceae bacterium]|nr:urea transporter [Muribaculaceae bacterium]
MKTPRFIQAAAPVLNGAGQVMFQQSAWTGIFFLIGIFWG